MRLIVFGLGVLWMAQTTASVKDRRWYSPAFGKSFVTIVHSKRVEETPRWAAESENPPLSARKALLIADKAAAAMEEAQPKWRRDEWSRELESVMLMPINDDWYWVVKYEWFLKDVHMTGSPPHLFVVVLMNGEVVPPREITRTRARGK